MTSLNRLNRLLVLLCVVAVVSPWVIYRRNQKRKLICREEHEFTNVTMEDEADETETVQLSLIRRKRDIEVDPISKEPIIFLGTQSNSSAFIDDGDFDIVSDKLTDEELKQVKQQIMDTCNALNSH